MSDFQNNNQNMNGNVNYQNVYPNFANQGTNQNYGNQNYGNRNFGGGMNNNVHREAHKRPGVSPERFEIFGTAALVFTVISSVLMYRNFSSICSVFTSVMIVIFMSFCIAKHEKFSVANANIGASYGNLIRRQTKLIPNYIGIILLGISVCLTGDGFIIFMNNILILFLVCSGLAVYFYDMKGVGFVRYGFTVLEKAAEPIGSVDKFFADYKQYRKENKESKKGMIGYILLGFLIAIPILFIMINLLASADQIFGDVIQTILGNIFLSWDIVGFILFLLVVLIYVYGMIVQGPASNKEMKRVEYGTNEPVIGITAMGLLTAVYIIFSFVQIFYLFANSLKLPDGLTYAEYARQGFFQLLFVSALNVVLVIVCQRIFRKNIALDIVLTLMSACTYIMIASSALRMVMYIREYDLTYLRFLVLTALAMLALVLAGVIIGIYSDKFPVVGYSVFVVMSIYIVISFVRPEHVIASYNLNNNEFIEIDFDYIMDLGSDAADVFYDYIEENDLQSKYIVYDSMYDEVDVDHNYINMLTNAESYYEEMQEKYEEKGKIRGFNFSRYKANKAAEKFLSR